MELTLRIVVDLLATALVLAMFWRLRLHVQQRAFRLGVVILMLGLAGNAALFVWDVPERDPDVAISMCVFAVTAVTRSEWARFVPGTYRVDGEDGDLAHSKSAGLRVVALAVLLYFSMHWLVTQV